MAKAVPDLIRRQRATEKTLAKYAGKPFDWATANCASALRSHLVAMGHKRLPKMPDLADALDAKRALTDMGFESMAALLDSLMPRIAPAFARLGDIVLMGGLERRHHGLDTVTFAAGGGKVAGWIQGAKGMVIVDPGEIKGVWRA